MGTDLPKPYYDHGGITIYHGDCREILPTLGKFDLLLTDMPYGEVNRESSGLRNLDKGSADIETATPLWVASASAGLCDSAYVFCGIEQVSDLRRGFVAAGKTTRLCIWEKSDPSPMNGEHLWLSSIESCVFAMFERMYPLAATTTELCLTLAVVLPAGKYPDGVATWHPSSGIFNAVANWARIEKAHAEAGQREPVAGLTLPRREPMPEKLAELLGEKTKRMKGARPLSSPRKSRNGTGHDGPVNV